MNAKVNIATVLFIHTHEIANNVVKQSSCKLMSDNKSSVKKILLVEDDRQLSNLVTEFLETEGFILLKSLREIR